MSASRLVVLFRLIVIMAILAVSSSQVQPASPVAAASSASSAPARAGAPVVVDPPTNQIIVRYKDGLIGAAIQAAGENQVSRLSQAAGAQMSYLRGMSGGAHVMRLPGKLPRARVQAMADRLMALPEVAFAGPDVMRTTTLVPNDALYAGSQWDFLAPAAGHYGINMPAAWDISTGSTSVVVAVIDTGILNHADLAGRSVQGYDFIYDPLVSNDGEGRDSNPADPGDWTASNACYPGWVAEASSWHGTHVSGTIGAASNNGLGVAGINWKSKILMARVLGRCGGYDSDIIDAIRWSAGLPVTGVPANANPAKVINLSLGGQGSCPAIWQSAINDVTAAGTTVVVAAGNSSDNASFYTPAGCSGVITVAATDRNGDIAWYSNYGAAVEVSAPGGDTSYSGGGILSTLNSGTSVPASDAYVAYQGTSMAAPHVAGLVSLLYSLKPSLTPAEVLNILQNTVTAFPGGSTCTTSFCGAGIINAGVALAAVNPPGAFNKISPADGTARSPSSLTLSWGASSSATSYEYCYDTSNNATCDGSWTSTTSTSAVINGLSDATTYYWQVRAINSVSVTNANAGAWWSIRVMQLNNKDYLSIVKR
jgi:serine protease